MLVVGDFERRIDAGDGVEMAGELAVFITARVTRIRFLRLERFREAFEIENLEAA